MDLDHPLARVIGELERRLKRVNLRKLSFDGVRAMLQAWRGSRRPSSWCG